MRFRHNGLKRLAEQDDPSGLPPDMLKRISTRVAQLAAARPERYESARGKVTLPEG